MIGKILKKIVVAVIVVSSKGSTEIVEIVNEVDQKLIVVVSKRLDYSGLSHF